MKALRRSLFLAVAAASGIGCTADAQPSGGSSIILSDEYGRSTTVGAQSDLREELSPAALTALEIVDEFKRICLDRFMSVETGMSAELHAAAASASSWGYGRREATLPAERNRAAFVLADFRTASAITSFWGGDNADALRGRLYSTRDRGAVVGGPVNPRDLYAPQCNLSLKVSGMADAAPLAAALETAVGAPATRLVVRDSFADGNWVIAHPAARRRVYFQAVDLKRPQQLIHLTVQILPVERR